MIAALQQKIARPQMNDKSTTVADSMDPAKFATTMVDVVGRSQKIATDFLSRHEEFMGSGMFDPVSFAEAIQSSIANASMDPGDLIKANLEFWENSFSLWSNTTRRLMGEVVEPVATPERSDRRFRNDAWNDHLLFDFIKQSYLISSQYVLAAANATDGLDEATRQRIDFFTRQFVDGVSPSNFVMTNPEVLQETIDSRGDNLVRGFKNILEDLERGEGRLQIKMTDLDAFELGKNVATTKGQVVFQNELIQLIQYEPSTAKVSKTPVLVIPPWINKYYILDLRPENSMIKWLVDQGQTVFVISWVNPDRSLSDKGFEDYLLEGPLAASEVVAKITGVSEINAVGYCLGGTLLAAFVSLLEQRGDSRVKSATYFTSMIDFSEPGELGVFIDEGQLRNIEEKMNRDGYLDGADMATTFNMLRSNDLIWSFVINNYLLGREPLAFDLLYWNSDSTRMPARMHSEYLRTMYLENRFKDEGGMVLDGTPIHVGGIKTPSYFLSTIEDHIAPWKSTFSGASQFAGPTKFVLSGSGHIAGVINPPSSGKYGYWTNRRRPKGDADSWFESASRHDGSWWNDWQTWLGKFGGTKVRARRVGTAKFPTIEAAPGSYAKKRLDVEDL